MSLGTEVDLGPGHIVLNGDPAALKGAQQPPLFGPCLQWSNGRPSQEPLSSYVFNNVLWMDYCIVMHLGSFCNRRSTSFYMTMN